MGPDCDSPQVRAQVAAFERAYAERAGMTVAELRRWGRYGEPCDCGDPICTGVGMGHQHEDALIEDKVEHQ